MQKINFQDLPSTSTPLNASNLNQLQTNVENAINEVVESGENANGNYVKYADGTMICYGNASGTTTTNQDYYGFCKRTNDVSFSYSQTFISAPIATITVSISSYISDYIIESTTTGATVRILINKNDTGLSYTISYIAIGKWK